MVSKKIRSIIADLVGYEDVSEITLELSLADDLQMEADALADVVSAIEEEFEIEIPYVAMDEFENVNDIVKYVKWMI